MDELLQTAVNAAVIGGEILRHYFDNGVRIRDKTADGGKSYDLVSDADTESEAAIAAYLHEQFPGHELLGEESLRAGRVDAEHLWIIDPLDGTNNFAHHIPHFAVSVAYYFRGEPTVGAIFNPIRADMFTAKRHGGAFHNGKPVQVSTAATMCQAMIGCGFYYDRGDMMRATLATVEACFERNIHGIRRFGTASLDLCAVGGGLYDAFFEYKLSAWDFAAGALFVTEAGGKITNTSGGSLPIGTSSVLASNGNLHDEMLGITKKFGGAA